MLGLVVAIIFSLEVAYFASQNSVGIPLHFVNYTWSGIPLYVVVVSSILIGVMISWFISAVNSASYFMKVRSKDSIIQRDKKELLEMKQRIQKLEVENERLKVQRDNSSKHHVTERVHETDLEHKPSILEKVFPSTTRHYAKQI